MVLFCHKVMYLFLLVSITVFLLNMNELIAIGTTIRIIVVAMPVFWDIETNENKNTMITINPVNSIPNNFLKFICDIFLAI